MPESPWRERLLQFNFPPGTLRGNQIRQYFHPEENVFPETDQRPTSLTNADPSNKWRSERAQYPLQIDLPPSLAGKDAKDFTYPYKIPYREALKSFGTKPGGMFGEGSDVGRVLGLGSSTRSIGFDPKGKPYLSNYDAWDFKDTGRDEQFMTKGGQPFNIYDRIPFDLDNGRFPKSIYAGSAKDINLPKER
jgi:hypothetical protein